MKDTEGIGGLRKVSQREDEFLVPLNCLPSVRHRLNQKIPQAGCKKTNKTGRIREQKRTFNVLNLVNKQLKAVHDFCISTDLNFFHPLGRHEKHGF